MMGNPEQKLNQRLLRNMVVCSVMDFGNSENYLHSFVAFAFGCETGWSEVLRGDAPPVLNKVINH